MSVDVLCAEDHEQRPMTYDHTADAYRCRLCRAMVTTAAVKYALPPEYQTGMGRLLAADFLDAVPYVVLKGDAVHTYFRRPSQGP